MDLIIWWGTRMTAPAIATRWYAPFIISFEWLCTILILLDIIAYISNVLVTYITQFYYLIYSCGFASYQNVGTKVKIENSTPTLSWCYPYLTMHAVSFKIALSVPPSQQYYHQYMVSHWNSFFCFQILGTIIFHRRSVYSFVLNFPTIFLKLVLGLICKILSLNQT